MVVPVMATASPKLLPLPVSSASCFTVAAQTEGDFAMQKATTSRLTMRFMKHLGMNDALQLPLSEHPDTARAASAHDRVPGAAYHRRGRTDRHRPAEDIVRRSVRRSDRKIRST